MNAKTRRKLVMATSALNYSTANPDGSPGYLAALNRLQERLERAAVLATRQRDGIIEVRSATARKQDLKTTMRQAHLNHLARVAEIAASEIPELQQKFVMARANGPQLAFLTAARSMHAEAQSRKEILVKHGLAETVLEGLGQALAQFESALQQGTDGRRTHVGASAELDAVADEVVQIVKVMDGLNRFRFADDAERLAAWESASNLPGPSRATAPKPAPAGPAPAAGEERPAA